jgi:hypothetical protein
MFLTRIFTFSPAEAKGRRSSLALNISRITIWSLSGRRVTVWSYKRVPDSTLPYTYRFPTSLNLSMTGIRRGFNGFLSGRVTLSRYSRNAGPLYHELTNLVWMLALWIDSTGIKTTLWKPQEFYRKGVTCYLINWKRFSFQSTVPIFVTTTISSWTPKALANIACYFVCPSFSKPDSNYPSFAETIRTAMSAWQAPIIMLGT